MMAPMVGLKPTWVDKRHAVHTTWTQRLLQRMNRAKSLRESAENARRQTTRKLCPSGRQDQAHRRLTRNEALNSGKNGQHTTTIKGQLTRRQTSAARPNIPARHVKHDLILSHPRLNHKPARPPGKRARNLRVLTQQLSPVRLHPRSENAANTHLPRHRLDRPCQDRRTGPTGPTAPHHRSPLRTRTKPRRKTRSEERRRGKAKEQRESEEEPQPTTQDTPEPPKQDHKNNRREVSRHTGQLPPDATLHQSQDHSHTATPNNRETHQTKNASSTTSHSTSAGPIHPRARTPATHGGGWVGHKKEAPPRASTIQPKRGSAPQKRPRRADYPKFHILPPLIPCPTDFPTSPPRSRSARHPPPSQPPLP